MYNVQSHQTIIFLKHMKYMMSPAWNSQHFSEKTESVATSRFQDRPLMEPQKENWGLFVSEKKKSWKGWVSKLLDEKCAIIIALVDYVVKYHVMWTSSHVNY